MLRSLALSLSLCLSACSGSGGVDDGLELDGPPSSSEDAVLEAVTDEDGLPSGVDELVDRPPPRAATEAWQVTVDPDDRPDPTDPNVLHIPVPPAFEKGVIAGAKLLVQEAAVEIDGEPPPPFVAQALIAELMSAEHAVVAQVTAVSPPLGDTPEGEPSMHNVTFTTLNVLTGTPPSEWTITMSDPKAVCAQPLPLLGTQYLLRLREEADSLAEPWSLHGIHPVEGDAIMDFPGYKPSANQLHAALAIANKEVKP